MTEARSESGNPDVSFSSPAWRELLERHHLASFTELWAAPGPEVEERNERRGGWSTVKCLTLADSQGRPVDVYLKLQQDHTCASLRRLGRPEATCAREYRAILALRSAGIPVVEPVCHGVRRHDGHLQAVLVTRAIDAHRTLDEIIASPVPGMVRRKVIRALAMAIRDLHRTGFRHGSLYPKHIYIAVDGAEPSVRFLDLERSRRTLTRRGAVLRDLDSLNRRTAAASRTDRMRFLLAYLGDAADRPRVHRLWRALDRRRLKRKQM